MESARDPTVRLIHWKSDEAKPRIVQLRQAGYAVAYDSPSGPDLLRRLRSDAPPDAAVIDLSRLPMQGRDVGLALRQFRNTRHVPIVFAGGDPEKVARVRKDLPDAVFDEWKNIRSAIRKAIRHAPLDPVVPKSLLEGYARTPLIQKLGLDVNAAAAFLNAPEDFEAVLSPVSKPAQWTRQDGGRSDVTLWFVRSDEEMESDIRKRAGRIGQGRLWIIWPKKSSSLRSDLDQERVRKAGLANGLVDYKICSIDKTWSGLLFTKRKGK